jgi:hypothetical protein
MFNLDRWAYYTAQKHNTHVSNVFAGQFNWVQFTPAQRRRVIKKARKNNDQTIGYF